MSKTTRRGGKKKEKIFKDKDFKIKRKKGASTSRRFGYPEDRWAGGHRGYGKDEFEGHDKKTAAELAEKKEKKHKNKAVEVEECPLCGSKNIREDFDYPKNMMCCDTCGADFYKDGEIILDPRKL